jgi:chromosomal replication initiator protein
LIVDDIQFIANKDQTQVEFFNTFNTVHESGKQIIITSDRPPKEMKELEERLRTRFEWGLIADIQPPDFELRIAIIKKKAEQIHLNIPDDVMEFLAENLRTSIRSIEGSIKTLSALSMLTGKELNMELANSCIAELVGEGEPLQVTIDKIFDVVQEKFNVNRADIEGTRRTKDIAIARHVAIYLIRVLTDMSLPSIGKMFNRDHSTIMNSIDAVEKRMRSDSLFVMDVTEMKKAISGQR